MGDTVNSPLRLQVFPQQKIKDLPKDQDIELTIVPKQVVQFQGIPSAETSPKLTITLDASGRSKLHYTPSNCRAGQEACFENSGLHELWVPLTDHPFAKLDVRGFSTNSQLKVPRAFFDSSMPFKILMGEISGQSLSRVTPNQLRENGENPVPEDLDDFFIGIADEKGVLEKSGLNQGGHDVKGLSEEKISMLRSVVKEVVSAGGGMVDEHELIRDFGFRGKFYLKVQGGKTYVIFKGYSGLRKFFKGTRYALHKDYSRFSILTIKQGPLQAIKQAGLKKTAGTAIGFLFMGFVNTWAWLAQDPESRFVSDLLIEIGSDAVKAIAGGVIASALIGVAALIFGVTVPVFAVIAGVAVFGVFAGLGLDFLDMEIGATEALKKVGRRVEPDMSDLWQDYVEGPFNTLVNRMDWEIRRVYGNQ